jgi:hypothetical protein
VDPLEDQEEVARESWRQYKCQGQDNKKDRLEDQERAWMTSEITKWIEKEEINGNLERVPEEEWNQVVVSPLFGIKKNNGEIRVLHDLRRSNKAGKKRLFQMQSVAQVRSLWYREGKKLIRGAKIDIKDAFRHLAIREKDRNWFGFVWKNKVYRMIALPFGWTMSPFYWNLVSMCIRRWMSMLEITGMVYVDDILVIGETDKEVDVKTKQLVSLLQYVGIEVNVLKSNLKPEPTVEYLGYLINLEEQSFQISIQKRGKIKGMAARELKSRWTTRRRLAALLGVIQGSREALGWINARTPTLYRCLSANSMKPWNAPMNLWRECRRELEYWANLKKYQCVKHYKECGAQNMFRAESDASTNGYGLTVWQVSSGKEILHMEGPWPASVINTQHSTAKEARTILWGLTSLVGLAPKGAEIHWFTDCTAAAAALRKYRSQSTAMYRIGVQMAHIVARMQWEVRVHQIPRELNEQADMWSRATKEVIRGPVGMTENEKEVLMNTMMPGETAWDLFPTQGSWEEYVYNMYSTWKDKVIFMQPPLAMVERVVRRIMQEKIRGLVILPVWRTKYWWRTIAKIGEWSYIRSPSLGQHPWRYMALRMR